MNSPFGDTIACCVFMLAGVLVASFPVPMSHDVCGNRALEKCLQDTIVCRFMMQFCRCSVKYVTLSDSVLPLSAAAQLVQIMPLLLDWLWGGAHVDHEQAGALSKVSLVHVYIHISLHFYCFWSAQGAMVSCWVHSRPFHPTVRSVLRTLSVS